MIVDYSSSTSSIASADLRHWDALGVDENGQTMVTDAGGTITFTNGKTHEIEQGADTFVAMAGADTVMDYSDAEGDVVRFSVADASGLFDGIDMSFIMGYKHGEQVLRF